MPYTFQEERANTVTHLLGAALIIFLWRPLLNLVPEGSNPVSVWIFLSTFLFVFSASAFYHATRTAKMRKRMKVIDHVAIYFFIAGSNTPYLYLVSDHDWALFFLVLMWILVVFGSVFKIMDWHLKPWVSLAYYLFMGWLGVVTLYLIYPLASSETIYLVIVGGIFYTVGAYFYHHDYRPWYHSIWHVFVLLGAFTHYAALFYQLI